MEGERTPRASNRYVSALRFRALNALYDPIVRVTTREATVKARLLEQANLRPGQRVLDVGCGTGTLALKAKAAQPAAEVVGLDGDPDILARAEAKAREAHADVGFEHGLSTDLPFEEDSFDRVLSTLFFHHLATVDKRCTIGEVARVLRPGGELHVADFTRPSDPVMWTLFWTVRLFDGLEQTSANAAGRLPALFEEGGFSAVAERDRFRTAVGTLALYEARWTEASS
jgi:ubiquinone/menaquinone biosynthesis C-methylase UbiE